ncbi:MAG: DUF4293 family protein [Bacteroidota bacterium]
MIQRVQNLYLILVFIALIILTIGTDVFVSNVAKPEAFSLTTHANVYGVQRDLLIEGNISDVSAEYIKSTTEQIAVPEADMKGIPTFYFPFFSITILMCILTAATVLSYKKLKRQLRLGRLLFVLNFLGFGTMLVLYYLLRQETADLGDSYTVSHQLGFGFYCIVIATAFSFLANIGIRRDIKLIKSIDRIR